eukprot:SAG22_NODE_19105_length_278_cov_0.581006_1_plen_35_part_01
MPIRSSVCFALRNQTVTTQFAAPRAVQVTTWVLPA